MFSFVGLGLTVGLCHHGAKAATGHVSVTGAGVFLQNFVYKTWRQASFDPWAVVY